MDAFDEQLKGLDTSKEGKVKQTVNTGKLNALDPGRVSKYSIYASFVRGGFLQGTLMTETTDDSTSTGSDKGDQKDKSTNSTKPMKETKEERRARKEEKRKRKEARALRRAAKLERRSRRAEAKKDTSDSSSTVAEEKAIRRAQKQEKRRRKELKKMKASGTPMNPERDLISRYIFVAGNNAYWRHHYQTWVTWFFPAGVEAFSFGRGYFPASIVKLCDDIPLGAARDWARWTHNSIYCTIEPHIKKVYDSFQPGTKQKPGAAIHVAFTDDELINKRTPTPIDAFGSWTALMTNAGVELMFLDPSAATDSGRAVGHLGFFRKHCRKGWDALAPFILDGTRPVFKENPAAAAAATSVKPIKAKL
ncbi:hypothetical protein HDU90_007741 [Geranomyces variabilis]|nr:hypothetical protein HDU90_007741 [Geranomyces variabilis]